MQVRAYLFIMKLTLILLIAVISLYRLLRRMARKKNSNKKLKQKKVDAVSNLNMMDLVQSGKIRETCLSLS